MYLFLHFAWPLGAGVGFASLISLGSVQPISVVGGQGRAGSGHGFQTCSLNRRQEQEDSLSNLYPGPPQRTRGCTSSWASPHEPRTLKFPSCSSQTNFIIRCGIRDAVTLGKCFPDLLLNRAAPAPYTIPAVSFKATQIHEQSKYPLLVEQLLRF